MLSGWSMEDIRDTFVTGAAAISLIGNIVMLKLKATFATKAQLHEHTTRIDAQGIKLAALDIRVSNVDLMLNQEPTRQKMSEQITQLSGDFREMKGTLDGMAKAMTGLGNQLGMILDHELKK